MMKIAQEISADSTAIAALLRAAKVGELVSYEAMSRAIGRDVSGHRGAISTARKIVLRENGAVFDAVRGEGMRRLNNSELVDSVDRVRMKIRRAAKRSANTLVCVEYDALPADKKIKHNASMSMLAMLSEAASEKAFSRLTEKVSQTKETLPAAKAALAALMMNSPTNKEGNQE